ncbi:hypothetical protein IMSAGC012_02444 [Lachnospiraceae bacterium]|nr:hypothetical protein IMSAGC012_02444 [Lachnospiraceae bacterium]
MKNLVLSPYMEIYELVVPKDNLLRQIKELVYFGFIYEALIDKYCLDNGRNAVPPVRMSKYFLDMAPEESVINPSSLTKFRKLRLKDMNLLDMLAAKTVQTALEKGIIKSKSMIVDATHTKSRYNQKTPRQALLEQSKKLRRSVYETDETMKERLPDKNTEDSLEKELAYGHALISVIKEKEELPELVRKSRETGQKKMNLNLIKMQGCPSVRQGIWQSINTWTGVKKKRRIKIPA